MSKRTKIIAVASALVVAIAAIPVYRYVTSPLSHKKIHIVMHDSGTLNPNPIVEREWVGCSIQIPRECQPKDAGAAIKAKATNFDVYIHTNEFGLGTELTFEPYVIQERKFLLNAIEKPVIDDEGFATIDGHRAYVITYHFETALAHIAVKTRQVYVDGFNDKTYTIRFACNADQWTAYADVFDSSLSTFHVFDSGPKRRLLDVRPF
jgi:hypothetical protein